MKGSCAERRRRLARAILRYLLDHPGAKATADGVARWWLSEERGASPLGDVECALALLASKGALVETRRAGVPPYYQLASSPDAAATAPRSGKRRAVRAGGADRKKCHVRGDPTVPLHT
jgi:hypothetical protein